MTRWFHRTPVGSTLGEAIALADALGSGRLVLHGLLGGHGYVGSVEVLWDAAADAVDVASAELEARAKALG